MQFPKYKIFQTSPITDPYCPTLQQVSMHLSTLRVYAYNVDLRFIQRFCVFMSVLCYVVTESKKKCWHAEKFWEKVFQEPQHNYPESYAPIIQLNL